MLTDLDNYHSDSDNDSDGVAEQPTHASPVTSALSLPSGNNGLPPKTKRAPKKIIVAFHDVKGEEETNDEPLAKKPRIEPRSGGSLLLSMLPAPRQKAPAQSVLGGGRAPALVFRDSRPPPSDTGNASPEGVDETQKTSDDIPPPAGVSSTLFRPSSVRSGRTNISLEEGENIGRSTVPNTAAIDFFSLGASSSAPTLPLKTGTPSSLPTVSSAPKVEEFIPPEPTPADEYPGYYKLPSGAWAAYEPAYYRKFYDKWQAEYNKHVRALEKGAAKGFEDLESSGAQDVNALEEMERAKKEIQEREEKKAITRGAQGGLTAPRMNIQGAKLGGRARSRHQLTTLLTEAYQNREALEEKIAEGRRNRKEAGNKYGF